MYKLKRKGCLFDFLYSYLFTVQIADSGFNKITVAGPEFDQKPSGGIAFFSNVFGFAHSTSGHIDS